MVWCRLTRKKHQSVDLTTPSRVSPLIKHKDPVTPQNQNRSPNRLVIGGGGGGGSNSNDVGNVSMSREASSRGSGAQSPTLPAMAFSLCVVFFKFISGFIAYCCWHRDGDRYLDDDDVLSSGQVSPLSTCSFPAN